MYIKTMYFYVYSSLGEVYSLLDYKILLSFVQTLNGKCPVL